MSNISLKVYLLFRNAFLAESALEDYNFVGAFSSIDKIIDYFKQDWDDKLRSSFSVVEIDLSEVISINLINSKPYFSHVP